MKKAISLTLALVMCLALIPMTALAYGNDRIQLEKGNFDPEELMVITFKGITQQMVDNEACAGIFKKGTDNLVGPGYATMPNTGEYILDWMNAPVEPGEYEVVLLSKWWQTGNFNDLVMSSVSFTVGKNAQVGTISLDKTVYKAMEPMTVSFSGISEQMLTSKAIVLMYEKGDPGQNVLQTGLILQSSGTFEWFAPNKNGEFEVRLYTQQNLQNADTFVMSVQFTVSGASNTSGWAGGEIEKANQLGLIPDCLKGQDLTKQITRREFAAVSVKLYENLTGKKATPAAVNPFTDTNDAEVLKAYNVGLTAGTAADKFSPDVLLNREQAATMLTRVIKAAYIPGWTLPTDNDFTLNFTMPAKFADDDKISDWAKPSVYFMTANKIISGTGNNMFSPKATTAAEEAALYASATREQALAIAVRTIENLKDKPLDFQGGGRWAAACRP